MKTCIKIPGIPLSCKLYSEQFGLTDIQMRSCPKSMCLSLSNTLIDSKLGLWLFHGLQSFSCDKNHIRCEIWIRMYSFLFRILTIYFWKLLQVNLSIILRFWNEKCQGSAKCCHSVIQIILFSSSYMNSSHFNWQ